MAIICSLRRLILSGHIFCLWQEEEKGTDEKRQIDRQTKRHSNALIIRESRQRGCQTNGQMDKHSERQTMKEIGTLIYR